MKYKDLKEMTIKEWNGLPFKAYVCDFNDTNIGNPLTTTEVCGYIANREYPWRCSNLNYRHVYPVEWNEEKVKYAFKPKRMTNRQLAMWLAKGNGQVKYETGYVSTYHGYPEGIDHEETYEEIKIRKCDSEEWIEPTVDLLEDC